MKKIKRSAAALALALLLSACRSTISSPDGPTVFPDSAPGGASAPGTSDTPDTPDAPESLTLEQLLSDIAAAAPGAAGSALRGARAAGELLDWIAQAQEDPSAYAQQTRQWIEREVPADSALDLALAWDGVLEQAEALLAKDTEAAELLEDAGYTLRETQHDPDSLDRAAQIFRSLFTYLLETRTPADVPKRTPGDYDAIRAEAFEGLWVNSGADTLLFFSGDTCRVVCTYLELWGETDYAFRIRDRSDMGYCPALEVDMNEGGDFFGALTYYVSGMEETVFWCSDQAEEFQRLF